MMGGTARTLSRSAGTSRGAASRFLAVALLAALTACTPAAARSTAPASPGALTVFAAASLRDAFTEAATAYQTETQVGLTLSFDASSALRTQIEQGAPADILASADVRNAQLLVDGGLADGAAVPFAGNLLTIIVPAANPASIKTPADLARSGVRVVAAGTEVPITQYAVQAIANLAGLEGYPAGYAEAVEANIVSREDNVRAVATRIELGEGDAALVYVTDADVSGEAVAQVTLPPDAIVPATYAAVVVGASARKPAAQAFLAWLTGRPGQSILARYGFTAPP